MKINDIIILFKMNDIIILLNSDYIYYYHLLLLDIYFGLMLMII